MRLEASLSTVCAACRSKGTLLVSQRFEGGRLSWAEHFACSCGHGFEATNAGLPTPAARAALMASNGRFRVIVESVPRGAKARDLLLEVLEAPGGVGKKALKTLPAMVWEGSQLESEFVRQAVGRGGATVRVEEAPTPTPRTRRARRFP